MKKIKMKSITLSLLMLLVITLPVLSADEEKKVIEISVKEYMRLMDERAKSVILPLSEYRSILKKIEGLKPDSETKEHLSILNAEYSINISDSHFSGTGNLRVKAFKRGWLSVGTFRGTSVSNVEEIMIGERAADFMVERGVLYVYFKKKGNNDLKFRFYGDTVSGGNAKSHILRLSLIEGLRTVTTVKVNETSLEYSVSGALLTGVGKGDKTTTFNLVNEGSYLNLSYSKMTRKSEEQEETLKVTAEGSSIYLVDKKYITGLHFISLNIQSGKLAKLEARAEGIERLLNVEGADISEYRVKRDASGAVIEFIFKKPLENSTSLIFQTESEPGADGTFGVKALKIMNVSRQTGVIGFRPLEPAYFIEKTAEGYDRMDSREVPGFFLQLGMGDIDRAYRYLLKRESEPERLLLQTRFKPSADVLTAFVKNADVLSVVTKDGKSLTRCKYELVASSMQFMRLTMKNSQTPLSVMVNGKPVPAVRDARQLIIPVRVNNNTGRTDIELVYLDEEKPFAENGKTQLSFPELPIPVRLMNLALYLPDDYRYGKFRGNMDRGVAAELTTLSSVTGDAGSNEGNIIRKKDVKFPEEELAVVPSAPSARRQKPHFDMSNASLSMKIKIPAEGDRFAFHSLILVAEAPVISFEYSER